MDKKTIIYIILLAASFYFIQLFFSEKSKPLETFPKETIIDKQVYETKESVKENFYVLENELQQIVFSDVGASIAEINLTLHNKNNNSIIYPIEFDEKILKTSAENSMFPQKPYFGYGFVKKENTLGGYYPLLRRSIYGKEGKTITKIDPKYYAFNVLESKYIDQKFKVTKFEKNLIEFVSQDGKLIKTFYFDSENAPYVFNAKIQTAKELFVSSGVVSVELSSKRTMDILKHKYDKKIQKISFPKLHKPVSSSSYVDWVSNSNGFFGILIDPLNKNKPGFIAKYVAGNEAPARISIIDYQHQAYPAKKYPGYEIFLPVSNTMTFRVFAGPYQSTILRSVDDIYARPFEGYNPDYIKVKASKGFFSFASEPFAKFLFIIMKFFYNITHSWGFSIILLTIIFRIMLFPLNSWSIKSTLKMQEITPLLKVIDAKYKKDPKQANLEKMRLFKEKGANPFSGCLPLLIQFPFLFGMFNLLRNTFDLRGASFIPGWINNLTSPDVLFSWSYPIFFVGTEFHLLPILLGIVMFVQSKMNMTIPKNGKLTDQQKQQKMMMWLMPILFVFLFYNAASGLNIYFLFSMFLGILQQFYMAKKRKKFT